MNQSLYRYKSPFCVYSQYPAFHVDNKSLVTIKSPCIRGMCVFVAVRALVQWTLIIMARVHLFMDTSRFAHTHTKINSFISNAHQNHHLRPRVLILNERYKRTFTFG